jgi:predicted acetyltransferase
MADRELTLRRATLEDVPALAANHLRSYPGARHSLAERAERFRAQRLFSLDTMTVAVRDGVIVGQARTLPFRCWLGGVESHVGGLAGVAVAPEARRAGIAAALVRDHLARCRADGMPWSMLYPFSPRFYAAHGWAPAVTRVRWRFRPAALPLHPERHRVVRLLLTEASDRAAVQRAYERHCVRVSGSLSRSDAWLLLDWGEDRNFVVGVRRERDPDELAGYLFYSLQARETRPRLLTAPELVAEDAAAERALLGFLAAQADHVDEILLDTPPDHPLPQLLRNGAAAREDDEMPYEHLPIGAIFSGLMARVVDLPGALAGRGWRRDGTVAFRAEDALVAENRAPVTVTVSAGTPRVAAGVATGAPLVTGDIAALSQVLVGALPLPRAVAAGTLAVEGDVEPAHTAEVLALPPPYAVVVY